ncbi:hypothetical protein, partial [Cyanobium sp. Cruz-8H5]|uniref:hypothetical protein n=1 Tax=Cyanobium sp. Cruz-8H5 TaxID=2823712 RepID=UPI0020CD8CEF
MILAAALACSMGATQLHAQVNQIASWTGGAGNGLWSDPLNWSPQVVPINDGLNQYNVIIPPNVNLTFDLPTPTTISGISHGTGGSLGFSNGRQLTVSNVSVLGSNVSTVGPTTLFNATGLGVALGDSTKFSATLGSVLGIGGVSYTYRRGMQEVTFLADGTGSVLDAKLIQTIRLTPQDPGWSRDVSEFAARAGGVLDLSGVRSIIGGPESDFIPSGTYAGVGRHSNVFRVQSGGVMKFNTVAPTGVNHFFGEGPTARFEFESLTAARLTRVRMLNLSQIQLRKDLLFTHTIEGDFNLDQGVLQLVGAGTGNLEVAGTDFGSATNGLLNFGIQQLIVGRPSQKNTLRLVDTADNGNRGSSGKEALYLLDISGTGLRILGGSTLNLNGLNAYTIINQQFVNLNSLFPAGQDRVAFDGGWLVRSSAALPGGWKLDGPGNWGVDANWNIAAPNGFGDSAYFGPVITGDRTVTLEGDKTAGYVGFEDEQSYTLAGPGRLTLDGLVGVNLEVNQGSHQITAPVDVKKDLSVTVGPALSTLRIEQMTAVADAVITKGGAGTFATGPVPGADLDVAGGRVQMIRAASTGVDSFDEVNVASSAILDL